MLILHLCCGIERSCDGSAYSYYGNEQAAVILVLKLASIVRGDGANVNSYGKLTKLCCVFLQCHSITPVCRTPADSIFGERIRKRKEGNYSLR